jgi:hypothetical protein
MQDENTTGESPAQVPIGREALRELAAAWIQWAREAVFITAGAASPGDAEFALLSALVDANSDPHKQECIVYAMEQNVVRNGYLKPCPRLPTDADHGRAVVDAICSQLAHRRLWGSGVF